MRVALSAILFATLGLLGVNAQTSQVPRADWQALTRGNEQFGHRLLQDLHSRVPGQNAVVSPLSLTLVLAAIQSYGTQAEVSDQIAKAFGWKGAVQLAVPARMLLSAFGRAEPIPKMKYSYPPEEAWIENRLWYRSKLVSSSGTDSVGAGQPALSNPFLHNGLRYFGIHFEAVGAMRPTDRTVDRSSRGLAPRLASKNDVVISSNAHLATGWAGNTFSESKPFNAQFRTESGSDREVPMLKSELSEYRYAKTEAFEAASLPCNLGYMVVVLPHEGRWIQDLEDQLVRSPEQVDQALTDEIGTITLPPFHTRVEWDLAPSLKQMGMRSLFTDLGSLFTIPRSRFAEVRQTVDIEVNQRGIRADAGTIAGIIYGGVMGGGQYRPFSMELNRPFIYLIRERFTDALLFAGVVMDPSLN